MSVSKKRQRDLIRLAHMLLGLPLGLLVYAPPALAEPIRLALQALLFPALVLSGLWMWLGPRFTVRRPR